MQLKTRFLPGFCRFYGALLQESFMQEMNYISSRSNPFVQRYAKLSDKKYRENERLFLLEGLKLSLEAADSEAEIEAVLVCEGKETVAAPLVQKMRGSSFYRDTKFLLLGEGAFTKISTEKSPEGVICVAKHLDNLNFYNKKQISKSLFEQFHNEATNGNIFFYLDNGVVNLGRF